MRHAIHRHSSLRAILTTTANVASALALAACAGDRGDSVGSTDQPISSTATAMELLEALGGGSELSELSPGTEPAQRHALGGAGPVPTTEPEGTEGSKISGYQSGWPLGAFHTCGTPRFPERCPDTHQQAILANLASGPIVIGINVYSEFEDANASHYLIGLPHKGSKFLGNHAVTEEVPEEDMNKLKKTAPPLKEGDLAAIEAKLGFALPKDLRAHYLKNNGGVPERRYFVDARGAEYEVARLVSMKEPAFAGDVLFETSYENLVVKKGLIPKQLVPFARGSGGDFYCIDREDGSVVFYAMDHCLEPKRATRKVAKSLAAFLDGMQAEL